MSEDMTQEGRQALVRFLPSCFGTRSGMWHIARTIRDSRSLNLREILGKALDDPDNVALQELILACEEVNGLIDLEGLITHFASYEHLVKFKGRKQNSVGELLTSQFPVAHTLLPLTLVAGEYRYECAEASFPIIGLVQLGPTEGTPYAHLASVIWFKDNGLSARILAEQARNGVAARAAKISCLDYTKTPVLVKSTRQAKEMLGL